MINLSLFSETEAQSGRPGKLCVEKIIIPDGELRYTSGFVGTAEASLYLKQLIAETPWQQSRLLIAGQQRLIPRLNAWYGDEGAHYGYSGMRMVLNPWTPLLKMLKLQVESALGLSFNSALLNYYRSGEDSVDWHSDDERELGHKPVIAALSLGVERRFDLRHKTRKKLRYKLDLEHGSLLVMAGALQHHWVHRVAKCNTIIEPRVNITFRRIAI